MADGEWIESYVPARLDRMPWNRWHWLIVVSLGATWILDGLEVTLAGSLGGILTRRETLGLSDAQVGASATFYLTGAVLGALLFGYGTDRLGRKKLFFITVAVYLTATALTHFRGISLATHFFARSRELASVANTPRLTRRSTN
jgi:MFS family permease